MALKFWECDVKSIKSMWCDHTLVHSLGNFVVGLEEDFKDVTFAPDPSIGSDSKGLHRLLTPDNSAGHWLVPITAIPDSEDHLGIWVGINQLPAKQMSYFCPLLCLKKVWHTCKSVPMDSPFLPWSLYLAENPPSPTSLLVHQVPWSRNQYLLLVHLTKALSDNRDLQAATNSDWQS